MDTVELFSVYMQYVVQMVTFLHGLNEDTDFCRLRKDNYVDLLCRVAPRFALFWLIQPFILQFSVQGYKLSQEASVRENPAFLLHTACR